MTIESLEDRYILVLGGSDGMGYATVEYLLRSKAYVTITGRTADKLEAARDRLLAGTGVSSDRLKADCGNAQDPDAVARAVSVATGPNGELDGIFIVAGGGWQVPVLETTLDVLNEQWAVNMYPMVNAVVAGAPVMIKHGGGSIVAISTIAAAISAPQMSAYGAAKAALEQYLKTAADELGPHKVRLNSIRSGYTSTGMTSGIVGNEEWDSRFDAATPLPGAYGYAKDFAPMASLLLSPDTSWITGQIIAISGGLELRGYAGNLLDPL